MKIQDFLKNLTYDSFGQYIWAEDDKGGKQLVAQVRGWGTINNSSKSEDDAVKFQDEVGEFIVQAIKEKLENLSK